MFLPKSTSSQPTRHEIFFYQPIPQTVTVEFDLVYAQAALNFIRSIIAALTKGVPLVE